MNQTLPILTDAEVSRAVADDESGFGSLRTDKGNLPLKAMDVQATLEGLLAEMELCQTFVNTFDEPLEATYIFPLPDGAAVTKFRMETAGRVVEGVLRERGAARREYDQALRAGHRAGIAEEERPGVFTMRVGNIMPGESVSVQLSLSGPLVFDDGEVTFRFPLVVAPRYIPGVPLDGAAVGTGVAADTDAVPDASRISPPVLLPGYPNPVCLSFNVDVRAGSFRPREFRCSLHSVFVKPNDAGYFRFQMQPGERLNRDFILRYEIGEEAVQSSLHLIPDKDNDRQGTFALTMLPPMLRNRQSRPRDIVFVLDRSGSMSGWKMIAARRAVAHMVDSLTERDRFAIYAFDNQVETPPALCANLVEASHRNQHRAIEYLMQVEARGGTEMATPLDRAVNQLHGERDRVLVLITDGQVGNEDQILAMLGKRLDGIRIFTLGIDQAVNEGFLKRLATLGGGSCDVVESENRLDEVMYKVHRRIGTPALSNVEVDWSGIEVDKNSIVPNRRLDLFAGSPVTIMGRYKGAAEGTATLRAKDDAGRAWSQNILGNVSRHRAAPVLWAKCRVRDLEDQFVAAAARPELLEQQIIKTSLQFGVLCRFTAFVAVDKAETVNEGGQQHKVVQAVEAPAGWGMLQAEAAAHSMLALPSAASDQSRRGRATAKYKKARSKRAVDLQKHSDLVVPPASAVPTTPLEEKLLNAMFGSIIDDDADEAEVKLIREHERFDKAIGDDSDSEGVALECDPEDGIDFLIEDPLLESRRCEDTAASGAIDDSLAESEKVDDNLYRNIARGGSSRNWIAKNKADASTPAPKQPRDGLFKSITKSIFGRGESADKCEARGDGTDDNLSAYRRRAKDLLEVLRQASATCKDDQLHALGFAGVKLGELLEDMRSIGVPMADVEPLARLHEAVTDLLAKSEATDAEVAAMWRHAKFTLTAFAKLAPTATVG